MNALDLSAALLEMYTLPRNRNDVDIEAESMAASAASVIAMAAHSTISPVSMLMIHCISTSRVSGNHQDMEKMAETLRHMMRHLQMRTSSRRDGQKKIFPIALPASS